MTRMAFRAAFALTCLALPAGCTATGGLGRPPGPTHVDPQNEGRLEQRAIDLLLRAADSDIDVVRANAIEALVHVAPDRAADAIRSAIDSPSPLVRFAGCVAALDTREKSAARRVQAHLSDPDERVRLAAAAAAYRLGTRNAARILLKTLREHQDENMRSDAAFLLGRLEEKGAIQHLKIAARREQSSKALAHIHAALAALGDRDGKDALIRSVIENNPISRLIALQALGERGDEFARDALRARLREEGDYVQVRLLAARALGRIGTRDGYALALASLAFRGEDENETMRVKSLAALALGSIGDSDALPALEHLAETDTDVRIQVAAAYAIAQISQPRFR